MGDPADHRRDLRRELRARRAGLAPGAVAAASHAVQTRLAALGALTRARVVAGYRAVHGEIDIDTTLARLLGEGATVTVPRVVEEGLEFVEWHPEDPTAAGSFGIPEPTASAVVALSRHDVVLAPLVAFDRAGHRLGQGGGYYDRAMAAREDARPVMIGVAHAFQEVGSIPVQRWDVGLDAVVTDRETIEFRSGVLDTGG